MINNELKPCCNDCADAKIMAVSDYARNEDGHGYSNKTHIFCDHMYVCKKYIEHNVDD